MSTNVKKSLRPSDADGLNNCGQFHVTDGRADGLGIPSGIRDDTPKPEAHPAHIFVTRKLRHDVGSPVWRSLRQVCHVND
jgi:hypothetical protein